MTELKNWLREQNFFQKSKEQETPSHLLYDGGKIYVPREKEHEFLQYYANELAKGSPLYYVETRPKVFKYMIDIDITDNHYWENEDMFKLVKFIQKIVFDFYQKNLMTICATSPAKEKKDGIHTGIHLIWPNLFVTSETAMILRRGIVQKLNEEMVKLEGKSWENIIDEVIYTRNGYRMVGSDKMSPTKIPENRPLQLKFVMNSHGDLNENYLFRLRENPKDLALETSIRYIHIKQFLRKDSNGMEVKLPKWLNDDAIELIINNGKKSKNNSTVVGTKEHFIIENFIQNNLPKEYNYKGIVKAVTRYEDGNLLIKVDSRHCMNLGKKHNSCGIFFFATTTGLYQKCLCPCDKLKGRKKGYCRDYTSNAFHFTEDIKNMLFPDYAKNKFIKEEKKLKYKYSPDKYSKNGIINHQKDICDKLFNDILSS